MTAIRETEYGPCPYLPGRTWKVQEFRAQSFDPEMYERALALGWRRSGRTFYRDTCRDCDLCVPIRLDSSSFRPSRSQRRLERKNADIETKLVASEFSEERFDLYRRYTKAKHGAEESPLPLAKASYAAFLIGSPLGTTMIAEYRLREDDRLVATGYVDVLPGGLSSVYFAFDPEDGARSLGTWSVLRELALAVELGKRFYYLGFWVPGSPKMDYKANFRPFQFSRDGTWLMAADKIDALSFIGAGTKRP